MPPNTQYVMTPMSMWCASCPSCLGTVLARESSCLSIRWAARNGRCGGTVSVRATVPGGVRSGDGDNYAIRWASQMCVTKSSAVHRGLAFCGTTCLSRLQSRVDDTPSRHILWNVFVTPAVRSRRHSIEACSVERFEAYYVERDCHACSQSRRQTTALQWLHRVIT